jgi:hypothetical protein
MVDVVIHGFCNKEEAIEFIKWYSEQGEQDITTWLKAKRTEGLPVRGFFDCDIKKTFPINCKCKTLRMYIEE